MYETLTDFLRRNEHQSLAILKETALGKGYTMAEWAFAVAKYYAL